MKFPWANSILLVLLPVQFVIGFLGFKNGLEANRWLLWIHGLGGYAIILILVWKGAVVVNTWRRGLEWSISRLAFLTLLLLLFGILATGLVWTFDGPVHWFGFSLMTWHVVLAFILAAGFVWHVIHMRFILRHPYARDRRAFFRLGFLSIGAWQARAFVDRWKGTRKLLGASRRFTGSYEVKSFSPDYPANIWLADKVPHIEIVAWQLKIIGERGSIFSLNMEELRKLPLVEVVATLDCTGGWYSTQSWQGIQIGSLLDSIGLAEQGRSITVRSASGYQRRFPVLEARRFLLATTVAGQPLSDIHGYPVRLVAPGRRGYDWVKWVEAIRLNDTSAYWQAPLPLQ